MTIGEFNEWMEQLDKYAKVLRDYGRLLTAIEDIKTEIREIREQKEIYISDDEEKENNIDYGVRTGLSIAFKIIDKHIGRKE